MALILILISIALPYLIERRFFHPITVTWSAFFFPILLFDIELSLLFYTYSLSALLIFILGYYFSACNIKGVGGYAVANISGYHSINIKFRVVFTVSFIVFLYNLSKVLFGLGFNAYIIASSKDIELTFGGSTIINYLFFLNMLIPSMSIILMKKFGRKNEWIFYMVISLFSLAFTGIKSTLLFGLMITIFTYLICYHNARLLFVVLFSPVLLLVILIMFFFVNLGGDVEYLTYQRFIDLFFGYAGYNYLNLDLELNNRNAYELGKYTFIFISKLIDPTLQGGYFASNDLILIDKNFNMGTFLREYFVDFGFYGSLFIVFIIASIGGILDRMKYFRDYTVLFYSIYLTACSFSFFGNQFIRLQFIYLFAASFLLFVFFKNVRLK